MKKEDQTKKFNLSSKINNVLFKGRIQNNFISTENIKEFIRLLKEEAEGFDLDWDVHYKKFCEMIDNLAGKELSNHSQGNLVKMPQEAKDGEPHPGTLCSCGHEEEDHPLKFMGIDGCKYLDCDCKKFEVKG